MSQKNRLNVANAHSPVKTRVIMTCGLWHLSTDERKGDYGMVGRRGDLSTQAYQTRWHIPSARAVKYDLFVDHNNGTKSIIRLKSSGSIVREKRSGVFSFFSGIRNSCFLFTFFRSFTSEKRDRNKSGSRSATPICRWPFHRVSSRLSPYSVEKRASKKPVSIPKISNSPYTGTAVWQFNYARVTVCRLDGNSAVTVTTRVSFRTPLKIYLARLRLF